MVLVKLKLFAYSPDRKEIKMARKIDVACLRSLINNEEIVDLFLKEFKEFGFPRYNVIEKEKNYVSIVL